MINVLFSNKFVVKDNFIINKLESVNNVTIHVKHVKTNIYVQLVLRQKDRLKIIVNVLRGSF